MLAETIPSEGYADASDLEALEAREAADSSEDLVEDPPVRNEDERVELGPQRLLDERKIRRQRSVGSGVLLQPLLGLDRPARDRDLRGDARQAEVHARGVRADVEEIDVFVASQIAADLQIRMGAVEEAKREVGG